MLKAGEKCEKAGVYKCTKCGNEVSLKANEACPTCGCGCTTFKFLK